MNVIHKRDMIRAVRKRWRHQYQSDFAKYPDGRAVRVDEALSRLDLETCSEADVDAVIGTSGWAANECDSCCKNVDVIIQIEHSIEDMNYFEICSECISKASAMLKSGLQESTPSA